MARRTRLVRLTAAALLALGTLALHRRPLDWYAGYMDRLRAAADETQQVARGLSGDQALTLVLVGDLATCDELLGLGSHPTVAYDAKGRELKAYRD